MELRTKECPGCYTGEYIGQYARKEPGLVFNMSPAKTFFYIITQKGKRKSKGIEEILDLDDGSYTSPKPAGIYKPADHVEIRTRVSNGQITFHSTRHSDGKEIEIIKKYISPEVLERTKKDILSRAMERSNSIPAYKITRWSSLKQTDYAKAA